MSDYDYMHMMTILQDSDRDFREDVSYAVAVAKAARSIAEKRALWAARREVDKEAQVG